MKRTTMMLEGNLCNAGEGLQLPIPSDWKRNAVVVFSNNREAEEGASVVARRETVDPRVQLDQYLDNLLVDLARSLPAFTLIRRRALTIAGIPAGEVVYLLTAKGIEYQQHQISAIDAPGSLLTLVLSSTQKNADKYSDLWGSILGGARLVSADAEGT